MKLLFSLICILFLFSGCGHEEARSESSLLIEPVTIETSVPAEIISNTITEEISPNTTISVSDTDEPVDSTYEIRSTIPDTETNPTEYYPEFEKNPPVVTKHPTSETVTEGGKALFVAHADRASGITWWLIPNDGSDPISAFDTSKIPGLIVSNPLSDTLTLDFIPLTMNGWHVKAEFGNPAGFTSTEPAELTVCKKPQEQLPPGNLSEIPDVYLPVIENCRYVQNHFKECGFWKEESEESRNEFFQKDIYGLGDGIDLLQYELGYTLLDLNSDGIKELIIGCYNSQDQSDYFNNVIFALFTIQDNSPVKVFQSWVRNRHYLGPDNLIRNEGSGGASNNVLSFFTLGTNAALNSVEAVWSEDFDGDGNVSLHYSKDGFASEDSNSIISMSEYEELYDRLNNIPIIALPNLRSIS